MYRQRPNYVVNLQRDRASGQLVCRVRKTWYDAVARAGQHRVLSEIWIDTGDMGELEGLAAALHDVAQSLVDGLESRP